MTREDFLSQLEAKLRDMPETERGEALRYFDELIQDKALDKGQSEEAVIDELGSLDKIAAALLERESNGTSSADPVVEQGSSETDGLKKLGFKASQVRQILISCHNMPITILSGNDDEVWLQYPDGDKPRFEVTLADGRLELKQEIWPNALFLGLDWLFSKPGSKKVRVILPREFAGSIDARTTNGRIKMADVNPWGELSLTSSNGRLELLRCTAKSIAMKTTNGRINVEDLISKGDISLNTGNGRIEAARVSSKAVIALHTSNGPLHFSDIEGQDISLTTSNSSIDGNILGAAAEYSVSSATSNGRNSLENHAGHGPKRLNARTSNGSIRVSFSR